MALEESLKKMTTLAAIPLFFQIIASGLCPVNQYATPAGNLCYDIAPSIQKPGGVDARFLDLVTLQYLETTWISSSTMLSKIETATTTYCWYDDKTTSTFACQ